MSSLTRVLNLLIKGKCNCCCLCFKSDEMTDIHQKLSIEIKETLLTLEIKEILLSIFGFDILEYLNVFKKICGNCMQSLKSVYTFIQSHQQNIMVLTKTLNALQNCIQSTKDENEESKSVFVLLNLKDFTTKQIYDDKKINSEESAFKRFTLLDLLKTKKRLLLQKSQLNRKLDIGVSDIKFEPSDPNVFKCKVCLKDYLSLWNLKNHYLRIHAPKNYKCPKCPKLYASPSFVAYHQDESHCEIICSECGKKFKSRSALLRHEKAHYLKLICADCGRTYKSKATYRNHIDFNICKQTLRRSQSNATFTCDYCGKKYTQKMSLRVHIQYNHGNYKAHVCKWCGKEFWAQSRLKAHIVKHTKEKKFTCSTCQRKFVSKESLLYHTRLHTGVKPYKCSECDSSFISASRRTYHMKSHHFGATIVCQICNAKFTSDWYLSKHKKIHEQPSNSENNKLIKDVNKKIDFLDSTFSNVKMTEQ